MDVKFTTTGMPAYPAPASPGQQIQYLQQVTLGEFAGSGNMSQFAFRFIYCKLEEIRRNIENQATAPLQRVVDDFELQQYAERKPR